MDNPGVVKAIAIVGSESQLARELEVHRRAVHYWRTQASRVPAHRAMSIVELCKRLEPGKARGLAHALRPDLW